MTDLDLAAMRARANLLAREELPYYETAATALSAYIVGQIKEAGGYNTPQGQVLGKVLHDSNSILGTIHAYIALASGQARTDIPALLDALDAVLALHEPRSYQSPGVRELPGGGVEAGMLPVWGCPLCRTLGPCRTARAAGATDA